jgi:hypothetical protein
VENAAMLQTSNVTLRTITATWGITYVYPPLSKSLYLYFCDSAQLELQVVTQWSSCQGLCSQPVGKTFWQ